MNAIKQEVKPQNALMKRFLLLLLYTAFIFLILWTAYTFFMVPCRMSGNNMFPSVKDGDFCIFYRRDEPFVGDVVLYRDGSETRIGRIIAKGGQTVDFPESGGYTVNGYTPAEELPFDTNKADSDGITFPIEIGEEEFFLLNDYRYDTEDGREFGTIKKSEVIGRLVFILRGRSF